MRIAIIGALNAPHELACTHWSGIQAAANRMEEEVRLFCCRSGPQFVEDIIEWKPDIIVYNLIDMAQDDMRWAREKLKDTGAKIVFWYTDCRNESTGQITVDLSDTVDLFLTSNDGLKEFQKQHFGLTPQWLPQAAEPTEKRVVSSTFEPEFIFIGGVYNRGGFKPRADIVSNLMHYHGLHLINGSSPQERAAIYNTMPVYYGTAKFSLDVSHFWDIPKYTSNRYWVIPAFWGLGLTKRFPDHEMLVPETHHVYWDTTEELLEKMEFYRNNEDERMKMVERGWQYAKDHHTYAHRIKKIIEYLGMC